MSSSGGMAGALRILLILLVIVAGVYDLRFRRIPNWLCLSGFVAGVGVNTLFSGIQGFLLSLLGLVCALAVYAPLYLLRGMGAGDVKLMAAVGAIVGSRNWLELFLTTAILGGLVSFAVIVTKKRTFQTLSNVAMISAELIHFRAPSSSAAQLDIRNPETLRLPHGAVIAGGTILYLLFSTVSHL
jgi:prepilin peptidase CpaA